MNICVNFHLTATFWTPIPCCHPCSLGIVCLGTPCLHLILFNVVMPSGPEYWLANTWILHSSTVATHISFQPEAFVEAQKWQDHDSLAAWKTDAHAMATASLQRAIKMLVGLVRSVIWSLVFVPRRFCWNSSQCHNQQDMNAGDRGNKEIVFPCV